MVPEDPETLARIRTWAAAAQPGDRLITAACDEDRDEEFLNWVRRALRP